MSTSTFKLLLVLMSMVLLALALWPKQEFQGGEFQGLILESRILPLTFEVADNPEEQAMGLSGRKFMPPDHGMLFVFPTPTKPGFWMKDMLFPLDIIWLDRNWEITQINEDVSPETYPKIYQSATIIKYVLELNAGVAKSLDLRVGGKVN
ncbi:MAG: hypothetical protein A2749_01730 [Parcubacteria group bacterium RIFCSPHIGHO2_01_FULL_45_26]|nr:MAG: hypothetical protein A2749_01730 [Parcubacteria group bacterium RIFCSPHIGHO2_01_FULL_45_26]